MRLNPDRIARWRLATTAPLALALAGLLVVVTRVMLADAAQRASVAGAWAGPFVMISGAGVFVTAAWIEAHLRWRHPDLAALRERLAQHAFLAGVPLLVGGVWLAGVAETDSAWVLLLFVHTPTLMIATALLGSTLLVVAPTSHRTGAAVVFIAAVVGTQCLAPPATAREPGELWFLLDSLVLGLAVAMRLFVWLRPEGQPVGA